MVIGNPGQGALRQETTALLKLLSFGAKDEAEGKTLSGDQVQYQNRVRAGLSPALPTPPGMRVRTGRFNDDGET